MKDIKYFKILFKYLKKDRFRLITYITLLILSQFERLFDTLFVAKALEYLLQSNTKLFITFLSLGIGLRITVWAVISVPLDLLYNNLEKTFMENVNKDLYKKITDMPAIAFEELSAGELINRMYNDPENILQLLKKLIRMSCNLIIAILIIIYSFTISPLVGLEFIILCLIMYLLSYVYYPKIKKSQKEIKTNSDEYVKNVTQNISGIREIKALGIKDSVENNIYKKIDKLFKEQIRLGKYSTYYYSFNNICYFTVEFLIILTLGLKTINHQIPISAFIIMNNYIGFIDYAIESIAEFGVSFNKVTVSLKRIEEILNNRLYQDEKFGNLNINESKCIVKFNDVKFKYHKEDSDYILKGLTMEIEPNKKIAIVGKSGEGKTTIFNLLLRYFDNEIGKITINNINIQDLSEKSLRETISIIRQDPYIFNTTIFNNFKIVKEDITLEEIRKVCKEAYIDDYIMSLPEKYDTLIGEGGVNLSGGQKQRIAIARTLLKDTKIILFDEATSALDNESQEYIKKTIDDLVKKHTIIIVAHRLSTIMDADKIFVIDDGKVSASGSHDDLIKNSKLYKKLYSPELTEID